MIQAVLFDMDGLLIDSEPLWRFALVQVLNTLGVPLTIESCKQTMGLRVDEVVEYWFLKYPWTGVSKEKVVSDIVEEVIRRIKTEGKIMDGVHETIALIDSQHIPMAIASSSPMNIIDAVLERIQIKDVIKVIHSAEHEPYGKPHPGVYITTAEKLGVSPLHCVAFEDSPNGILSAKAAKMKCIAVPDPLMADDKRFGIADLVISSLANFTLKQLADLES